MIVVICFIFHKSFIFLVFFCCGRGSESAIVEILFIQPNSFVLYYSILAMGESSAKRFCLKILVAKDENKVIMAESNKEFIEVLFSFMTLPIARAVGCTRSCLSGEIGSLSNLYQSVKNLDMNFLQDKSFQDILLSP